MSHTSEPVVPEIIPNFEHLVEQLQHASGVIVSPKLLDERPLYGTTLFIAKCQLETRFGLFRAYIFQDIIDKHYIVALAHGNITSAKTLYTRLHSSCITSETLRGCDCDCVQQLEGAFKVIAEKGDGILFYLMQEGRGVGYVGKARDRMLTATHTAHAPWVCVRANSKKAARIAVLSHLLQTLAPKPLLKGVEKPDPKVLFTFEPAAITDGRLAK